VTGRKPTPNPIELVCQELVELVTDYLSGELLPEDRVRFEKHLLTCPSCTAYLTQIQTMRALSAELDSVPPSAPNADHVDQKLADLFRSWHDKAD
jgi:anti-sigma factor RsiW